MTDLTKEAVEAALAIGEPTCTKCGAPRSKHPYRHLFQASHETTLMNLAPDLARAYLDLTAENERLRDQAVRACVLSGQDLAEGDWGPEGRNMAVMIEKRVRAALGAKP